jgi:hypothetical protein
VATRQAASFTEYFIVVFSSPADFCIGVGEVHGNL